MSEHTDVYTEYPSPQAHMVRGDNNQDNSENPAMPSLGSDENALNRGNYYANLQTSPRLTPVLQPMGGGAQSGATMMSALRETAGTFSAQQQMSVQRLGNGGYVVVPPNARSSLSPARVDVATEAVARPVAGSRFIVGGSTVTLGEVARRQGQTQVMASSQSSATTRQQRITSTGGAKNRYTANQLTSEDWLPRIIIEAWPEICSFMERQIMKNVTFVYAEQKKHLDQFFAWWAKHHVPVAMDTAYVNRLLHQLWPVLKQLVQIQIDKKKSH